MKPAVDSSIGGVAATERGLIVPLIPRERLAPLGETGGRFCSCQRCAIGGFATTTLTFFGEKSWKVPPGWNFLTSLPTCSRQPLQCKEAPFTATVKQAAQQQAPCQTWCEGSTGEHALLLRDYLAAALAMPPRCASAQLSAESRRSSAGTIAGSRAARAALMSVVYGRGPFLLHHTPR